jgi:hypothetical protein
MILELFRVERDAMERSVFGTPEHARIRLRGVSLARQPHVEADARWDVERDANAAIGRLATKGLEPTRSRVTFKVTGCENFAP